MKTKVVIFGAAGHTGKYIVRQFQKMENVEVTAFVRNPAKFEDMDLAGVTVVQGDALNATDVKKAISGQDVVLCSLEGDVLSMAKNVLAAAKDETIRRIVWITGMGIHHEIKGLRGKMLGLLAKSRSEYIQVADLILNSNVDATLLRCPGIMDGDKTDYFLTTEDTQPRKKSVDRASIAKCMADIVNDENIGKNQSLGITN